MADDVTAQTEAARCQEQVRLCAVSRDSRRATCEILRAWYDRGNTSGPRSKYSMIRSHLDRVGSYLFSPDTIRFGWHLPPASRKAWAEAGGVARDEFASTWADSGADLTAAMMTEWSLVYGSTIAMARRHLDTGFTFDYINQWDFGVINESNPILDEQTAFCHWYSRSIPQIEWWVRGEPRADALLALAHEHKISGGGDQVGRPGLVVTGITGSFPNSTITGGFFGDADTLADVVRPQVEEALVTFVDLWEYIPYQSRRASRFLPRTGFSDWRVTTMIANADLIFARRRNPVLPWTRTSHDAVLAGDHPFVAMRPRPLTDYFWGRSEITGLMGLEELVGELLPDIQKGVIRKLRPSHFGIGISDHEEVERALMTPDGVAQGQEGQKLETIKNDIGAETFQWLQKLEGFFGNESGIPESLVEPGSVPGGVRNTGQFSQVAGIASGRIRKMALMLADPLSQMATKGFHVLQRHDTTAYPLQDGREFLLSQLPPGYRLTARVHSYSPIFAEQTMAKADRAIRVGAITGERYLSYLDLPDREEAKLEARELAKAKAEERRELVAAKAEKERAQAEKARKSRGK